MRTTVVKISEITKDPNLNMSAGYWCKKKNSYQSKEDTFKPILDKEMQRLEGKA